MIRAGSERALGKIRTSDTRFRKPVLYPLSYEGKVLRNIQSWPITRSREILGRKLML